MLKLYLRIFKLQNMQKFDIRFVYMYWSICIIQKKNFIYNMPISVKTHYAYKYKIHYPCNQNSWRPSY